MVYIMVYCVLSNGHSVYMVVFTGSNWEVHHVHQDHMSASLPSQPHLRSAPMTTSVRCGSATPLLLLDVTPGLLLLVLLVFSCCYSFTAVVFRRWIVGERAPVAAVNQRDAAIGE